MRTEKLESIYIDVEKDICQLNGEEIGSNTSELHLDYENGEWSLQVTQDRILATHSDE